MENKIALRPSYWASVSGGKDSLFMLKLILNNLDRYQLDGVVHFELEIDFPFIHDVIDYMESECKRFGIRFARIKPRKTWEELYYTPRPKSKRIRGFPTPRARWCNSEYKLDGKKQLEEFLNSVGCYTVHYIGYCADEVKRYSKKSKENEIYPLVEFGIEEGEIWKWAKTQTIFNHYYETQKRCGCMYCPMASRISMAYLLKYYPENFEFMIDRMRETERIKESELGHPFAITSFNPKYNADYLDHIVRTKWIKILEEREKEWWKE